MCIRIYILHSGFISFINSSLNKNSIIEIEKLIQFITW